MEADRQLCQPDKGKARNGSRQAAVPARQKDKAENGSRQAARPARRKDKQGMEAADRQQGQQGKRINKEWKQTGSQASQAKG